MELSIQLALLTQQLVDSSKSEKLSLEPVHAYGTSSVSG